MTKEIEQLKKYVRATNYLVVTQLYLRDNFLLKGPLSETDIKPRLLGHWGTCPGINFVYAHLNLLIKKTKADILFILGPGHGFPALQANLFLEGTLEEIYSEAKRDEGGIAYVSRKFSTPYGFPSHSNPETPGVILEGGELGYSLSTAYGAVLDNPDLIVATLIGDGEAETGPLATAWHINKFIDPATNGAVLPILHLNGYKISGPTVFGRMSDKELISLFEGYGYEPIIVAEEDKGDIYSQMAGVLSNCYQKIRMIQNEAKEGKKDLPRFPMIILKTPKGWTGVESFKGEKLEGNCASHQIILKNARERQDERRLLRQWLASYKFQELFSPEKGFSEDILDVCPPPELRMGKNKHANQDEEKAVLELPETEEFAEDARKPGTIGSSSMRRAGLFLKEVFRKNADKANFRLFSPDETYSNKLDAVFEETERAFVWPTKEWDKDISPEGRVIEMLSEHSLQGLSQGYILTGRRAVFASYEAFIQIVSSMADQYAKFLRIAREVAWRKKIPTFVYILTSSGWRQEHNGFSHQNPGFVSNMLAKHGCFVKIFFPPDGNSMLETLSASLKSTGEIHVLVAGKTLEPRWLTTEMARKELLRGLMIWDFASDENPDIVLCGIGDYLTKEALAALSIIKKEVPDLKIRFVNVLELTALGIGDETCRLPFHDFNDYFTKDKPVIFNFYGYPEAVSSMLIHQSNPSRFRVNGYIENGSTTTPFDMHIRNKTSRYNIVMQATEVLADNGRIAQNSASEIIEKYKKKISEHRVFIKENGVDPEEIEKWTWKK